MVTSAPRGQNRPTVAPACRVGFGPVWVCSPTTAKGPARPPGPRRALGWTWAVGSMPAGSAAGRPRKCWTMWANAIRGSATRMRGRPLTGTVAGATAAEAPPACQAPRGPSSSTKGRSPGWASVRVRALEMGRSASPRPSPRTHSANCRPVTLAAGPFFAASRGTGIGPRGLAEGSGSEQPGQVQPATGGSARTAVFRVYRSGRKPGERPNRDSGRVGWRPCGLCREDAHREGKLVGRNRAGGGLDGATTGRGTRPAELLPGRAEGTLRVAPDDTREGTEAGAEGDHPGRKPDTEFPPAGIGCLVRERRQAVDHAQRRRSPHARELGADRVPRRRIGSEADREVETHDGY